MTRKMPFSKADIDVLSKRFPTPFYIYDETSIRATARQLIDAFSWSPGFKEYFAVKATPNTHILSVLRDEGCGADCSSLAELLLSEKAGITGSDIMFTSNDTPTEEFVQASKMGALINLDAVELIPTMEQAIGVPEFLSLRYNPGNSRDGNAIIGKPAEAKFGMTLEQLFEGYRSAKEKGVKRFGLHTMIASNELQVEYFLQTAEMLFQIAVDVKKKLGITIELVNFGGGIGIPYRPSDVPVDIVRLSSGIKALYERYDLAPLRLSMECGRFITGPSGYLVARVRHLKTTYRNYAGVDATMANLMRPGMYGAYHEIVVLGKENVPASVTYDVVGSLCENNDKFAVERPLPLLEPDDILVICDAGAHGHAMGFNYNGKLRSAEFLRQTNGEFKLIRRAETLDDLFSTLVD